MLTRPALSEAATLMAMLLPVHTLPVGEVMLTVGGVVSPPPPPPVVLLTVTETVAVAVRPAPSVTVRFSVWVPLVRPVVFQLVLAVEPLTLWLKMVAPLSTLRTNEVGEPCTLLALMVTGTALPLTVAPLAGLLIAAPSTAAPLTFTVSVGGLTLLSPRLSSTVRETVYVPGVGKTTAPGFWTVLLPGVPPGKSH